MRNVDYREEAKRLAEVLIEKLSCADLESLIDILGDDTTDQWFFEILVRLHTMQPA